MAGTGGGNTFIIVIEVDETRIHKVALFILVAACRHSTLLNSAQSVRKIIVIFSGKMTQFPTCSQVHQVHLPLLNLTIHLARLAPRSKRFGPNLNSNCSSRAQVRIGLEFTSNCASPSFTLRIAGERTTHQLVCHLTAATTLANNCSSWCCKIAREQFAWNLVPSLLHLTVAVVTSSWSSSLRELGIGGRALERWSCGW